MQNIIQENNIRLRNGVCGNISLNELKIVGFVIAICCNLNFFILIIYCCNYSFRIFVMKEIVKICIDTAQITNTLTITDLLIIKIIILLSQRPFYSAKPLHLRSFEDVVVINFAP